MISIRTFEEKEYKRRRFDAVLNAATRFSLGFLAFAGLHKADMDGCGAAGLADHWTYCPWQIWCFALALLIITTVQLSVHQIRHLNGIGTMFHRGALFFILSKCLVEDMLQPDAYAAIFWSVVPQLHYYFGYSVAIVCIIAHTLPFVQRDEF